MSIISLNFEELLITDCLIPSYKKQSRPAGTGGRDLIKSLLSRESKSYGF